MIRHVARRWIYLASALLAWPCLIGAASAEKPKSPLIKLPVNFGPNMENTPVIYRGMPLLRSTSATTPKTRPATA